MNAIDLSLNGAAPEPEVLARFPTTANQRHIWQQMDNPIARDALNASFRRRLEGSISDGAVTKALQGLVDRHEILRTRFRMQDDGRLEQEVLRKLAFKPDVVDLRHLPSPQRDAELDRLGVTEARKHFAVADGIAPLFRVLLVRLAADLAYVHFTFHQLVIDGWSVDLLSQEFGRLAAAADGGAPADLAPVEMQFGDYALWQNDVLASGALDAQRDYWRGQLAGLPHFGITPDRPGPRTDCEGQIRSVLLPKSLTTAFEHLAHANRHTLFSLTTAAAAAALHLVSGAGEVVLGTQTAGREDPDAEHIVGQLLNTVVLRLPVMPADNFLTFAERVRGVTLEATQNQLLPFAEVARLAGAAEGRPLYKVNLVVQHTYISTGRDADRQFGAFRVASAPGHSAGALWDLSLFMVGREEGWRISCEGASALYDSATIDALLAVWRKVMEGAVAHPQALLAELAVLEPHERRPASPAPETAPQKSKPVPPRARVNPRLEALRQRIIPLRAEGDGVPIMAINNASLLYPVARAIEGGHPFYDIQFCPSPVRMALPLRHFSDHARDAVEMIRLARPHGPYVLFGLCIFGAIALEAARILRSEGEDVPLVVLVDTYRPGFRENMSFLDRHIRAWQVRGRSFNALRQRVASGELTMAQWIDNYRLARRLHISAMLRQLGITSLGEVHDPLQDNNRWFPEEVLRPSQARFDLEPYPGDVLFFRNMEMRPGRLFPPDFGWTGHIEGRFDRIEVPGSHDTIFRPEGAAVMGPAIRQRLEALGF
ncbi:condensation domain-containing protein [Novosphingobium terrae]|uniref:condensation domain-containing protein n=1 Tax=Novosphingobium terrae TaxID=2726189 RepID=UPI001980BEB1|nr:condensation domain-containing protein [Novosphingobium terrae]